MLCRGIVDATLRHPLFFRAPVSFFLKMVNVIISPVNAMIDKPHPAPRMRKHPMRFAKVSAESDLFRCIFFFSLINMVVHWLLCFGLCRFFHSYLNPNCSISNTLRATICNTRNLNYESTSLLIIASTQRECYNFFSYPWFISLI